MEENDCRRQHSKIGQNIKLSLHNILVNMIIEKKTTNH